MGLVSGLAEKSIEEVAVSIPGREDDPGVLNFCILDRFADERLQNRLRLHKLRLAQGVRLYLYELQQLVDPVVHHHPMSNRPRMAFC